MKSRNLLLLALLVPLAGCTRPTDATTATARSTLAELQTRVQDELSRMGDRLDYLKERAAAAGAETRQKLQPQIEQLERDMAAARSRLDQLRQRGVDAWNAAKPELEKSVHHLGDAIDKALNQLKK
jgi:chromosome segregation ATPase